MPTLKRVYYGYIDIYVYIMHTNRELSLFVLSKRESLMQILNQVLYSATRMIKMKTKRNWKRETATMLPLARYFKLSKHDSKKEKGQTCTYTHTFNRSRKLNCETHTFTFKKAERQKDRITYRNHDYVAHTKLDALSSYSHSLSLRHKMIPSG